jgi:carboxylesterase
MFPDGQGYNLCMPQIIPTAEPFFFPGNRTGILLVHAFTGTPKEMRWMGEDLNRRGYTVCGIRLAGHATRPADMVRSRWQDWLLSVEDGCHLLHSCTDRIFLAGLSTGGVLALIFASQFPVVGVIAMSTPYSPPDDWRLKYVKLLSRLKPYIPKGDGRPGAGWFGDAWRQHVAYPEYPLRSVGELRDLLEEMRLALPQVRVPVLLVCTRDDHPLICAGTDDIRAGLGICDVQQLWLEGSGHTVTEEPQREVVFQAAADFIARVSVLSKRPGLEWPRAGKAGL